MNTWWRWRRRRRWWRFSRARGNGPALLRKPPRGTSVCVSGEVKRRQRQACGGKRNALGIRQAGIEHEIESQNGLKIDIDAFLDAQIDRYEGWEDYARKARFLVKANDMDGASLATLASTSLERSVYEMHVP